MFSSHYKDVLMKKNKKLPPTALHYAQRVHVKKIKQNKTEDIQTAQSGWMANIVLQDE